MEIQPVAVFHSPFKEKFGLSRQAGLNASLKGYIEMLPPYQDPLCIKGMEGFDYLWLIWGFSKNGSSQSLTVRPPALGGNETMGVFATRSPFRPCPLGLSSVKISSIEVDPLKGPLIHVLGADLMDGTPIYDIKPYLAFCDSHPQALGGFTRPQNWRSLEVQMPDSLPAGLSESDILAIKESLRQDPRPRYQEDSSRVYGMAFKEWNVRFKILENRTVEVLEIV